jgi:hypothetical protein
MTCYRRASHQGETTPEQHHQDLTFNSWNMKTVHMPSIKLDADIDAKIQPKK